MYAHAGGSLPSWQPSSVQALLAPQGLLPGHERTVHMLEDVVCAIEDTCKLHMRARTPQGLEVMVAEMLSALRAGLAECASVHFRAGSLPNLACGRA